VGSNEMCLMKRTMQRQSITYKELFASLKKGLRNRNWRRLNLLDKALYRAAVWYAKHNGSIVNGMLVKRLLELVEELKETKGVRIFKRGLEKATAMLKRGENNSVFMRAPRLKEWLKDPNYIFWLGTVR